MKNKNNQQQNPYIQNMENTNMNQQSNQNTNPYINKNTNNDSTQMMQSTNPYMNMNANTNQTIQASQNSSFSTTQILTGALVGAAAIYVLTNENLQKTIFKGALSAGEILSSGLDEMKERFEDAKAEHEAVKEA